MPNLPSFNEWEDAKFSNWSPVPFESNSEKPYESPTTSEATKDDGSFQINDIQFIIPPANISVTRNSFNEVFPTLRSGRFAHLKSGRGVIQCLMKFEFTDINVPGKRYMSAADHINKILVPLIAQLEKTPFILVKNKFLANQIALKLNESLDKAIFDIDQLMLAVSEISVDTMPEVPGGLEVGLKALYFNHRVFVPKIEFLKEFDTEVYQKLNDRNSTTKVEVTPDILESEAFKKFYIHGLDGKFLGPSLSDQITLRLDKYPLGVIEPKPFGFDILNPDVDKGTQNQFHNVEHVDPSLPAPTKDVTGPRWEVINLASSYDEFKKNGTGLKPIYFSATTVFYLSILPILDWEFPAIQYLGAKHTSFQIDLQAKLKDGYCPELRALQDFYALIDRRAIENKKTRSKPLEIVSDIAQLMGVENVSISQILVETTENPEISNVRLALEASNQFDYDFQRDSTFKFVNRNTNRFDYYGGLLKGLVKDYEIKNLVDAKTLKDTAKTMSFTESVKVDIAYADAPTTLNQSDALTPEVRQNYLQGFYHPYPLWELKAVLVTEHPELDLLKLEEDILLNLRDLVLYYDPINTVETLFGTEIKNELRRLYVEEAATAELSPGMDQSAVFNVVKVEDGDTVVLSDGTSVRILGVNTPEIAHPQVPGSVDQPGGVQATEFLQNLITVAGGEDRQIVVQKVGTDLYGRTLAKLYFPDGTSINGMVASQGYGTRDFSWNKGFIPIHKWFRSNHVPLYWALSDESRALLDSIVNMSNLIEGQAYPDFKLDSVAEQTGGPPPFLLPPVDAQKINPDFYIYNPSDDLPLEYRKNQQLFRFINPIVQDRFDHYQAINVEARRRSLQDNKNFDSDDFTFTGKVENSGPIPIRGKDEQGAEIIDSIDPQLKISQDQSREGLSKTFETVLENHIRNDKKFRRSYPTFMVYFLDEDDVTGFWKSYSDFFSLDTVQQIMIVRTREMAADTAYLRISNLTGSMLKEKSLRYNKIKPSLSEDMDTISENAVEGIVLQEGTRIQIKLGYDNDPNKLTTVFNGIITSLSGTETIEVYCQSFGIELVNGVVGYNIDSPEDNGVVLCNTADWAITEWFTESNAELTRRMCQDLLCRSEIQHFGRWTIEQGIDLKTFFWDWVPRFGGGGISQRIRPGGEVSGTWKLLKTPVDDNIFIPEIESMPWQEFLDVIPIVRLAKDVVVGPALHLADAENLVIPLWKKGFTAFGNSTVWDVFQELTLRYPNYICMPVPFDDRMTLFFGHPDHVYSFRAQTLSEELGSYPQIKSISSELEKNIERLHELPSLTAPLAPFVLAPLTLFENPEVKPISGAIEGYGKVPGAVKATVKTISSEVNALSDLTYCTKPFREYHIKTSLTDIISNDIRADFNDTYTVCHVRYPEYLGDKTRTIKLDADIPDPDDWNAALYLGSYREFVLSAPNCGSFADAGRYGVQALCNSLKYLYKGELVLIGDADIKPHDIINLFDMYNDMSGSIGVRQVVHNISPETGFITTVTPDCIVAPTDYFSMSLIDAWWNLCTVEWIKTVSDVFGHSSVSAKDVKSSATTQAGVPIAVAGAGAKRLFSMLPKHWAVYATAAAVLLIAAKTMSLTSNREPVIISPLLRGGVPFINGVEGLKRGDNYFVMLGQEWTDFWTAFNDGFSTIFDSYGEKIRDISELIESI